MSRIPDAVLDEIKDKISISEVVSEYVKLNSKGGQLWGLCPFHEEKSPSFTVHDDKGFYHCFGCGKGGSVFNFIMDIENIGFIDAVKLLAEKAGVALEEETPEMQEQRSDKQAMLELYKRLAESFHYIFMHKDEASHAREYLEQRKISLETVKRFKVGYAPADSSWLYRFLRAKKYTDEFLEKSGVFSRNNPRYPIFRDRLMFPIFDQSGNVIAFGGRALDEGNTAKYLNSPDTVIFHKRKTLFGLYQSLPEIKKSNTFIVCEGYFDVLSLFEAGVMHAVAPLGTAFTEDQAMKLFRYANTCSLLFDSDRAGQEAAKKAALIVEKLNMECKVIQIQDKDPSDILQNSNVSLLKNIEKEGITSFTYMINRAKELYDYTSPNGKLAVFNEVQPFLEAIQSDIKLSSSIKTLAEEIDVDEQTIISDLQKQRKRPSHIRESHERTGAQRYDSSLELYLMLVIVHNRDRFLDVRRQIHLEDMQDHRAKEIYTALEESLREGETSFENLLNKIELDSIRNLVLQSYGSHEYVMHVDNVIRDLTCRFRIKQLEAKRKAVLQVIKSLEREEHTDMQRLQELLYEKKFIDEEIGKIRN